MMNHNLPRHKFGERLKPTTNSNFHTCQQNISSVTVNKKFVSRCLVEVKEFDCSEKVAINNCRGHEVKKIIKKNGQEISINLSHVAASEGSRSYHSYDNPLCCHLI